MINKKYIDTKLYFPLIAILIYSLSTIFIFAFGPIYFESNRDLILYLYLLLSHLFIFYGYRNGLKQRIIPQKNEDIKRVLNLISILVLCNILINISRDFMSGLGVVTGIENANEAREIWRLERGGGILGYLSAITSILNIPFLGLCIIFWKYLSYRTKLIFFGFVIYLLFGSVAGASRHGLMMLIVVVFIVIVSIKYSGRINLSKKQIIFYFFLALVLFLFYASFITLFRRTIIISDYVLFMSYYGNYDVDINNFLIPNFGGVFKILDAGILEGYFYFTHGYNALSKALNLPFIGVAWGFGHSDFTIRNISALVGEDFLNYSYYYRLVYQTGYLKSQWVTSYAWIASDVTFLGSLFVLYFFSKLMAKSWVETLSKPTILSVSALAWLFYMFSQINIIFVPADLGAFISFWGVIILYARSGKCC